MTTETKTNEIQKEETGRTFWDFFHKRPLLTVLLIFVILGLLVFGLLDVKIKDGSLIISANPKSIENIGNKSDNSIIINDWVGYWRIGWRYNEYFDNPAFRNLERDMEFRLENEKLIGEYTSTYNDREVRTQLYDFELKGNSIVGKYKGIFTDDKNIYETGEIELLLFSDKRYFIGKYKRTKPNTFTVDGNYRLWFGRK